MKKWYLAIATLSISSVCIGRHIQEEWINIFVHGAVALRANLSPALFRPLVHDRIEGTCYERNVVSVREHPFLFTMQAMQKLGLRRAKSHISSPPGAYAFSLLFDQVLRLCQGSHIKNKYYTFGWTGLLSYKRRYHEARIFYKQIREKLMRLKAQGRQAKVRIVAYSHGGNLALNLPALRANEFSCDTFCIDELVLLGMPVSKRSEELVQFPLFKKIYHIYSKRDIVQRLDITVPGHIPQRTFRRCVPDNITQIELKMFAPVSSVACDGTSRYKRGIYDQSPGHFEFWFFGWAPHFYRSKLAIYPLPFALLVPCIIRAAHAHPQCPRHVTVDVRPYKEVAFVSDRMRGTKVIVPFLPQREITKLQEKAIRFHPGQPRYVEEFLRLQSTINPETYK